MEPLAGLFLGLAGSLHCVGMCGPIVVGLQLGKLTYQVGRVVTYMLLGLVSGLGAGLVALSVTEQTVSIVAGILMILSAIVQIFLHRSIIPGALLMKLTQPVRHAMQQASGNHSQVVSFGMGLLNGLLPCGLVFSAVLGAASAVDPVRGALFMGLFGIGTIPAMWLLARSGRKVSLRFTKPLRIIFPTLALAVGGILVVRGMGLGIPYLSPAPYSVQAEDTCHTTSVQHSTQTSP
jgi:sulfite exporter TauE/SafE